VANCLRLLNLSENAQQDLRLGRISAGHARALLSFENPEERENIRKRIVAEKISVREVEALAFAAKEEPAAPESPAADPAPAPALEQLQEPAGEPVKGKKPRSAVLMELQTRISRALQLPVKINGQEDRGRLSIKFSSSEELNSLLAKFGMGEN
jgi:ParB family chromosome partitioning protein